MLYSKLIGKTKKQVSAEEQSINAKLLIKAGFIQKQMAGVYAFLPLGLIVLEKITQVIRTEMNNIGANELLLSALQNKELYEKSNRWNDDVVDVWFKTKLHNGTELGLGFSHEEPLIDVLKEEIQSYKDLPVAAYQFQNKFRNELRAKAGLLRTREFIMKDLYSFHQDQQDLDDYYQKVTQAYINIYTNLGIIDKTFKTFASGGVFSKYSHEYQTICDSGEDIIYVDTKKNIAINKEVYSDEIINELGLDKDNLKEYKSIEVGNTFKLGTKFTQSLNLKVNDKDGQTFYPVMGCYGIGIGRLMATIVEVYNDENGIIWPEQVAPFKIHLIGLNLNDEEVNNRATQVYNELLQMGYEVLFDDRQDTSTGNKFADSDLIGCPYRVVVSKKTADKIEFKDRRKSDSHLIDISEIKNHIK